MQYRYLPGRFQTPYISEAAPGAKSIKENDGLRAWHETVKISERGAII